MKKVVVVGGGVAGLTMAYQLVQKGRKVTVLEKEEALGGLARSFRYGDFVFDIGPHRFHTDRPAIEEFIKKVLGDSAETIVRRSGVWMFNRYFSWPLHPSVIVGLPPMVIIKVGLDLLTTIYHRRDVQNFEDYIVNMYGRTLYDVFFKKYTEKFLEIPPDQTHVDWARTGIDRAVIDKRLKMNSLVDLIISTLFKPKKDTYFIYPTGGIDIFCTHLADMIRDGGGTVLSGAAVDDVRITGPDCAGTTSESGNGSEPSAGTTAGKKRISAVKAGDTWYDADEVVWTAPLPQLMGLLEEEHGEMDYLALLAFNFELDSEPNAPFQWCYFGADDISFNRITNPALFSDSVVPAGRGALCVEVTCRTGDEKWNHPEKLYNLIVSDLVRTRVIEKPARISAVHVEKVPYTYPIYTLDYLDIVKAAETLIDEKYENIYPAGRTGLFWYNNMDQSIEQAMELAGKLTTG